MSDAADIRRKRVLFRCHHTGMLENDLLIGAFADRHLTIRKAVSAGESFTTVGTPARTSSAGLRTRRGRSAA